MRQRMAWTMAVFALLGMSVTAHPGHALAATHISGASHRTTRVWMPVRLTWGTHVLRGTMRSTSIIRMTGAFSIGHAASFDWNLPRPTSMYTNGYREFVQSVRYLFTVAPSSWVDTTRAGHPVRHFHWVAPPANTVIRAVERLQVTTESRLSPLATRSPYPLKAVAPGARRYLATTPLVALAPWAKRFTRSLVRGKYNEKAVVAAVVNWFASHVHYAYGVAVPANSAMGVLRAHSAICGGYADLTAAMLRSLRIPTQVVFGLIAGKPIDLGEGPSKAIGWGAGIHTGMMHAWLNVYFPDVGWVPLDPQLENFFIDTRHIAFETNIDAGATDIGTWTAHALGAFRVTGQPLSDGLIAAVPGDGLGSGVSVSKRDAFHVQISSSRADVRHVMLFSR